jgi:hypothetical protein
MTYKPDSQMSRGAAAREIGIPRREIIRAIGFGALRATKTDAGEWIVLGADLADYARKRNAPALTIHDLVGPATAAFHSNRIHSLTHEEPKQ